MVRPPSRPGVARVCVEVDLLKKKPNLIGSGYSKSNFKLRSKKSSTTDAANKEKSKQQPSAPNSNAYRKKSSQGQRGKAPPRQVYRPTGKTVQSSFENTYNLPKKTADNQTEQNLFLLINNKKTSQHIQISADPSTSTASHDSQLRVDSSHQVIVDAIDSSLAANNSNVDNSSPAIEETSNHSRHEAPEKAWRTSFVESSIGPNAYHMGDRPVRQRTMLDFSINFLISRLTDIYLIEPQRTERANVVKAKAEKPRAAPAREIKVERADISTAFGCSAFARIAAFLTGNGPLKSNPRSFDSVHLVARPSFALTLRCLLWPIGEPLKAALLKKGDTSCHLAEPTSLLAANRTTKKMRRNHRSLSFKPLRRIGRMKASKKQLTLRRIPLCDSDEEGGSGASSSSPVMIATVSGHFGESSCRMRNRRDWWVGDAPLDQSRHEQRVNHRYEGTCGSLRVDPREKPSSPPKTENPASIDSIGIGSKRWSSLVSHLLALSFMGSFLMMVKEASRREEKKRSSLADGLLAKIEALALRKLAMFEWDPLFSP
ncbi:hypothetical protein Tco_0268067 [Tanacetum coccineum]